MKRLSLSLPSLISFTFFILLCVSLTYWVLKLIKPSARPMVVVEEKSQSVDSKQAALELFGRSAGAETASNFQLTGVVVANKGNESVAILANDGKPASAFTVGKQVAPGTTLQEIHPQYVVLSENGVQKRIALPLPVNAEEGKERVAVVTKMPTLPSRKKAVNAAPAPVQAPHSR